MKPLQLVVAANLWFIYTIKMNKYNGLLLLNKPNDITSSRVLNLIKERVKTKRVGHTGTLDKFASGLLLILVGKYTKLADLFMELDKEYQALIQFGTGTDTLDPQGKIISRGPVPAFSTISKIADKFKGEIEQIPPLYSAVHIDGKRAYQHARQGNRIKLNPRRVKIHELKLVSYNAPDLLMWVSCSKGTYIRALARDMAALAGTCAYVKDLKRIRVGNFKLEHAVPPVEVMPEKHLLNARDFIGLLKNIGILHIKEEYRVNILNGARIKSEYFDKQTASRGTYAIMDNKDNLLALIKGEGNRYHYQKVLGEKVDN